MVPIVLRFGMIKGKSRALDPNRDGVKMEMEKWIGERSSHVVPTIVSLESIFCVISLSPRLGLKNGGYTCQGFIGTFSFKTTM